MKRIKLIILPLIVCAFITGCNNSKINNEDNQTNNKSAQASEASHDKVNKNETADVSQADKKKESSNESLQTSDKNNNESTQTSNVNDNSVEDEVFFGDWTITDTVASGSVSIYSTEDINKIIGIKIYYGKDKFVSNDIVINNPIYETSLLNRDEIGRAHV